MENRETGIVSIYLKIAKLVVHNVTNEVREYYLYDHLIIPAKYFLQRTGGKGEMMASTNLQKAGSRAGAGSGDHH